MIIRKTAEVPDLYTSSVGTTHSGTGLTMNTVDEVSSIEDSNPEAISILGVPVHNVTTDETLALVRRYLEEPRVHQIATVNPEFVMTAQRDVSFRQVLNDADLCIPDGIGLLFAARRIGKPLKERVAGSDLVHALADEAAKNGWSLGRFRQ